MKDYNATSVEELKAMKSYRGIEFFVDKGSVLKKTIDCFTWIGNVQLAVSEMSQILISTIVLITCLTLTSFFFYLFCFFYCLDQNESNEDLQKDIARIRDMELRSELVLLE